jgi:hypothetical protein
MMNPITTQTTTTIAAPLPKIESPQFPLDPTNPLVWLLLITALLGNTDEVINAMAKLIEAIASLKGGNGKPSAGKKRDRKG